MSGMFKKKKKKDKSKNTVTQQVPVEEGMSETLIEENDIQNILGDVLKGSGIDEISEKLDETTRKMDEIQSRLERHDSLISSVQNEITEMRNLSEEMQDNIKRLLDIYEVVSQKINPFVDMQGSKAEPAISEEPIIGESSTPDVVSIEPVRQEIPRVMETSERVEKKRSINERNVAENTLIIGKDENKPILTSIRKDYYTVVLLMRWVEFLFERVKRDKITLLLDYYVDIGWISKTVKSEIMAYARGEVQDVSKYFPEEEIEAEIETPEGTIKAHEPKVYKKVNDWRLSAEDHLKSLLFIMKIAGVEVNKDRLNSLEQEIEKFKKSLWEFHGV